MLSPKFFINEELTELPPLTRLLFAGLWTLADREGRLEDKPRTIKAQLFPWDDVDIDASLDALQTKGLVTRYEVDGQQLLEIDNFLKYQHPHHREPDSSFPAQPRASLGLVPEKPVAAGRNTEYGIQNTDTVNASPGKRKAARKEEPSPEFLAFWSVYPRSEGKQAAWRCWQTRLKEGYKPQEMIDGATRYKRSVVGKEKQYMKLASTFLGPDLHFMDDFSDKDDDRFAGLLPD